MRDPTGHAARPFGNGFGGERFERRHPAVAQGAIGRDPEGQEVIMGDAER